MKVEDAHVAVEQRAEVTVGHPGALVAFDAGYLVGVDVVATADAATEVVVTVDTFHLFDAPAVLHACPGCLPSGSRGARCAALPHGGLEGAFDVVAFLYGYDNHNLFVLILLFIIILLIVSSCSPSAHLWLAHIAHTPHGAVMA